MKRICLVDFDMSVTGGVEQVTASLANSLCQTHEVFLYAINNNYGQIKYKLNEKVHYTYALCGEIRLRNMIRRVYRPFRSFVKRNKIDVVILMGNYPAFIMSFAKWGLLVKYIYCDHGALMNQWHQKDIRFIRFINAITADKIIVLTKKTRKDYIRKFRIQPEKIQCIYNWVDPVIQTQKCEYSVGSRKILTVGRLCKEKGYDLLLEVAREVLSKEPEWSWEIFGEGDIEISSMIRAKIAEYGLEGRIILSGNVIDAYKHYHEYSFLVLTSYREGLPIVLLEAKALGLPMVSFDVETGPAEIIENKVDGYLIEPYNCDKMAKVILKLTEDEELRASLSKGTGNNILKFDYMCTLQEWVTLLNGL